MNKFTSLLGGYRRTGPEFVHRPSPAWTANQLFRWSGSFITLKLIGLKSAGVFLFVLLLILSRPARACDLCAISSANNSGNDSGRGFLLNISEQFVPYDTPQINGKEFRTPNPDFVDSSTTYIVSTYNFSRRFGVSLNVPIVNRDFKRATYHVDPALNESFGTEQGNAFGLSDLALISRLSLFQWSKMKYSFSMNLLAGVRFPTGNASRLRDEVEQARRADARDEQIFGPGHPHELGGIVTGGVHQSDLALGSGSFDGIAGLTANARWKRCYLSCLGQYYIRTRGESGYRYGNELMISGGPGAYLLLRDTHTLSLQVNAAYETRGRDVLLGRKSDHTGMTGWYLGPLLTLTVTEHFSLQAGVDLPLRIANNGYMNVPDYRAHGGLTWRF